MIQNLTPRENDVIRELCVDAARNKVLAFRLGVKEGTLNVYMARICDKLRIEGGREGIIPWAARNGRIERNDLPLQARSIPVIA